MAKRRGKKWPHGPVSKAQWRWWGAQMSRHTAAGTRWGHEILERAERQKGEKVDYRSLPFRKRGPRGRTIRKAG